MAFSLDKVKELFQKKDESVLGVDISSSTIKVVQLRRKAGKAVLETYGELSLGPYIGVEPGKSTKLPPDKLALALRDLMKEARVTTNRCGVAIPLSSSMVNVIEMPDVGEDRLKEMLPLEMRRYIPVNISEVMLDWRLIPGGGGEMVFENEGESDAKVVHKKMKTVEVLVVAIHKDTISRFQQIVRDAELNASFLEVEVFSTIRSVLVGNPKVAMIVDIGAGTTKIYIVEHRVLRQSHSINRGSQDITLALSKSAGISAEKAEELKRTEGLLGSDKTVNEVVSLVTDHLFAEIHRVMLGFEKRHRQSIAEVIFSGGGAGLAGLAEAAKRSLEVEVSIADPFAKVETPAFLEDVLKTAGPDFALAVGVALRKLEELS